MVIMDAKRFNELIDQYDPLNKKIALEFLSISKEYPYFQLPYYYHAKSQNLTLNYSSIFNPQVNSTHLLC